MSHPQHSSTDLLGPVLLKEVEQLAREKCLDHRVVFSSLEQAFQKTVNDIYGACHDIRVQIDQNTGRILVTRHLKVTREVNDPAREVTFDPALHLEEGQEWVESIPLPSLNRSSIQTIRTILVKNIQNIERENQYNEFKDKVGQITSGIVKRIEGMHLIVDIGHAEGIIYREELIPKESYRVNDRVKGYIYAVRRENYGSQIFLSRTHPEFLAKLFAQEVPEIYDGLIEIKAVARDPGSRAKVAITSKDERDSIGTCVGVKGSRVNAVSQELQGEKIDIVLWSSELPVFVVNALTPAEVVKVILEKKRSITVVVPDPQLSIAIGRKGQNVRLAYQLTGARIDIITETAESQQRTELRQKCIALFMDKLDLDELMAHFLVSEGFENIQELAEASVEELMGLEGFTSDIAQELKLRAEETVGEENRISCQSFLDQGGDVRIIDMGMPPHVLKNLAAHRIFSIQDLADLSLEELKDILGDLFDTLEEQVWGQLILKARHYD